MSSNDGVHNVIASDTGSAHDNAPRIPVAPIPEGFHLVPKGAHKAYKRRKIVEGNAGQGSAGQLQLLGQVQWLVLVQMLHFLVQAQ